MDLQGFTTIDEVGDDDEINEKEVSTGNSLFPPNTAAEEIDYLNKIILDIEKDNDLKDTKSNSTPLPCLDIETEFLIQTDGNDFQQRLGKSTIGDNLVPRSCNNQTTVPYELSNFQINSNIQLELFSSENKPSLDNKGIISDQSHINIAYDNLHTSVDKIAVEVDYTESGESSVSNIVDNTKDTVVIDSSILSNKTVSPNFLNKKECKDIGHSSQELSPMDTDISIKYLGQKSRDEVCAIVDSNESVNHLPPCEDKIEPDVMEEEINFGEYFHDPAKDVNLEEMCNIKEMYKKSKIQTSSGFVPKVHFKVENYKHYSWEQVSAALLMSQSSLALVINMDMFNKLAKSYPLISLTKLENLTPLDVCFNEHEFIDRFFHRYGTSPQKWKKYFRKKRSKKVKHYHRTKENTSHPRRMKNRHQSKYGENTYHPGKSNVDTHELDKEGLNSDIKTLKEDYREEISQTFNECIQDTSIKSQPTAQSELVHSFDKIKIEREINTPHKPVDIGASEEQETSSNRVDDQSKIKQGSEIIQTIKHPLFSVHKIKPCIVLLSQDTIPKYYSSHLKSYPNIDISSLLSKNILQVSDGKERTKKWPNIVQTQTTLKEEEQQGKKRKRRKSFEKSDFRKRKREVSGNSVDLPIHTEYNVASSFIESEKQNMSENCISTLLEMQNQESSLPSSCTSPKDRKRSVSSSRSRHSTGSESNSSTSSISVEKSREEKGNRRKQNKTIDALPSFTSLDTSRISLNSDSEESIINKKNKMLKVLLTDKKEDNERERLHISNSNHPLQSLPDNPSHSLCIKSEDQSNMKEDLLLKEQLSDPSHDFMLVSNFPTHEPTFKQVEDSEHGEISLCKDDYLASDDIVHSLSLRENTEDSSSSTNDAFSILEGKALCDDSSSKSEENEPHTVCVKSSNLDYQHEESDGKILIGSSDLKISQSYESNAGIKSGTQDKEEDSSTLECCNPQNEMSELHKQIGKLTESHNQIKEENEMSTCEHSSQENFIVESENIPYVDSKLLQGTTAMNKVLANDNSSPISDIVFSDIKTHADLKIRSCFIVLKDLYRNKSFQKKIKKEKSYLAITKESKDTTSTSTITTSSTITTTSTTMTNKQVVVFGSSKLPVEKATKHSKLKMKRIKDEKFIESHNKMPPSTKDKLPIEKFELHNKISKIANDKLLLEKKFKPPAESNSPEKKRDIPLFSSSFRIPKKSNKANQEAKPKSLIQRNISSLSYYGEQRQKSGCFQYQRVCNNDGEGSNKSLYKNDPRYSKRSDPKTSNDTPRILPYSNSMLKSKKREGSTPSDISEDLSQSEPRFSSCKVNVINPLIKGGKLETLSVPRNERYKVIEGKNIHPDQQQISIGSQEQNPKNNIQSQPSFPSSKDSVPQPKIKCNSPSLPSQKMRNMHTISENSIDASPMDHHINDSPFYTPNSSTEIAHKESENSKKFSAMNKLLSGPNNTCVPLVSQKKSSRTLEFLKKVEHLDKKGRLKFYIKYKDLYNIAKKRFYNEPGDMRTSSSKLKRYKELSLRRKQYYDLKRFLYEEKKKRLYAKISEAPKPEMQKMLKTLNEEEPYSPSASPVLFEDMQAKKRANNEKSYSPSSLTACEVYESNSAPHIPSTIIEMSVNSNEQLSQQTEKPLQVQESATIPNNVVSEKDSVVYKQVTEQDSNKIDSRADNIKYILSLLQILNSQESFNSNISLTRKVALQKLKQVGLLLEHLQSQEITQNDFLDTQKSLLHEINQIVTLFFNLNSKENADTVDSSLTKKDLQSEKINLGAHAQSSYIESDLSIHDMKRQILLNETDIGVDDDSNKKIEKISSLPGSPILPRNVSSSFLTNRSQIDEIFHYFEHSLNKKPKKSRESKSNVGTESTTALTDGSMLTISLHSEDNLVPQCLNIDSSIVDTSEMSKPNLLDFQDCSDEVMMNYFIGDCQGCETTKFSQTKASLPEVKLLASKDSPGHFHVEGTSSEWKSTTDCSFQFDLSLPVAQALPLIPILPTNVSCTPPKHKIIGGFQEKVDLIEPSKVKEDIPSKPPGANKLDISLASALLLSPPPPPPPVLHQEDNATSLISHPKIIPKLDFSLSPLKSSPALPKTSTLSLLLSEYFDKWEEQSSRKILSDWQKDELEILFSKISVQADKFQFMDDALFKKIAMAQHLIEKVEGVPLVGLQLILEVQKEENPSLENCSYICSLCSKKMSSATLIAHIKSVPHRLKYTECFSEELHQRFGKMEVKQWTAALVREFTLALQELEKKVGREKIAVTLDKSMTAAVNHLKNKINMLLKKESDHQSTDAVTFTTPGPVSSAPTPAPVLSTPTPLPPVASAPTPAAVAPPPTRSAPTATPSPIVASTSAAIAAARSALIARPTKKGDTGPKSNLNPPVSRPLTENVKSASSTRAAATRTVSPKQQQKRPLESLDKPGPKFTKSAQYKTRESENKEPSRDYRPKDRGFKDRERDPKDRRDSSDRKRDYRPKDRELKDKDTDSRPKNRRKESPSRLDDRDSRPKARRNDSPHRRRSPSPRRYSPYKKTSGRSSPFRYDRGGSFGRKKDDSRLDDERKLKDFRADEMRIKNEHFKQLDRYIKDPESHPRYKQEWERFWDRRYREVKQQGLNTEFHDFKAEWLGFWPSRLREICTLELKTRREELLVRYKIPDPDPTSKVLDYFSLDATKQDNKHRGPLEKGTKASMTRDRYDTCSRKDGASQNRYPLKRNRSPSPWEKGSRFHAKNDTNSAKDPYEIGFSVVGTLKLLTELEDQLGSLAPASKTLFKKAVEMAEKGSKPINLFEDNDNLVLLRLVNVKFSSLVASGILDVMTAAKTQRAIESTNWLMKEAEKFSPQSKPSINIAGLGLDLNLISTATIGMNTVQIAQYIAEHLYNIGKPDVNESVLQDILIAISEKHSHFKLQSQPSSSVSQGNNSSYQISNNMPLMQFHKENQFGNLHGQPIIPPHSQPNLSDSFVSQNERNLVPFPHPVKGNFSTSTTENLSGLPFGHQKLSVNLQRPPPSFQQKQDFAVPRPVAPPQELIHNHPRGLFPTVPALFPSGAHPVSEIKKDMDQSASSGYADESKEDKRTTALSLLQTAYDNEEEGSKDKREMDSLPLEKLQELLSNFRKLNPKDQQNLTDYLKRLEATDNKKVTKLRSMMHSSKPPIVPVKEQEKHPKSKQMYKNSGNKNKQEDLYDPLSPSVYDDSYSSRRPSSFDNSKQNDMRTKQKPYGANLVAKENTYSPNAYEYFRSEEQCPPKFPPPVPNLSGNKMYPDISERYQPFNDFDNKRLSDRQPLLPDPSINSEFSKPRTSLLPDPNIEARMSRGRQPLLPKPTETAFSQIPREPRDSGYQQFRESVPRESSPDYRFKAAQHDGNRGFEFSGHPHDQEPNATRDYPKSRQSLPYQSDLDSDFSSSRKPLLQDPNLDSEFPRSRQPLLPEPKTESRFSTHRQSHPMDQPSHPNSRQPLLSEPRNNDRGMSNPRTSMHQDSFNGSRFHGDSFRSNSRSTLLPTPPKDSGFFVDEFQDKPRNPMFSDENDQFSERYPPEDHDTYFSEINDPPHSSRKTLLPDPGTEAGFLSNDYRFDQKPDDNLRSFDMTEHTSFEASTKPNFFGNRFSENETSTGNFSRNRSNVSHDFTRMDSSIDDDERPTVFSEDLKSLSKSGNQFLTKHSSFPPPGSNFPGSQRDLPQSNSSNRFSTGFVSESFRNFSGTGSAPPTQNFSTFGTNTKPTGINQTYYDSFPQGPPPSQEGSPEQHHSFRGGQHFPRGRGGPHGRPIPQ